MNRFQRLVVLALVPAALLGAGERAPEPAKPAKEGLFSFLHWFGGKTKDPEASSRAVPVGTMPPKTYTNASSFPLPIVIDERDRAQFHEIRLFCKSGSGAWECQQSASPSNPYFACKVPKDGEYWYSGICVDREGKQSPSDPSRAPPDLVVVVDTQPPEVEVQPQTLTNGKICLRCMVHDANPDYTTLRLDYQTSERRWRPLEPMPNTLGAFLVPSPEVLGGRVRVNATDRAGNKVMREINLDSFGSRQDLQVASHTDPTGGSDRRSEKNFPRDGPKLDLRDDVNIVPARREAPRPEQREESKSDGPQHTGQLINTTRASLSYQIGQVGPSGLGKIEVWITRDQGRNWKRLCDDPDCKSPVEIELPGEGLYGLRLVVSNGSGFGNTTPGENDEPDLWVEVDATKPVAQLQKVHPATGSDAPTIFMSWTSSDKNLGLEPVDLYYSTRHGGPWMPIAQGLNKEGNYRWPIPRSEGSQYYIRLAVTDQAGNKSYSETEPLVLDLLRPTPKMVRIEPIVTRPENRLHRMNDSDEDTNGSDRSDRSPPRRGD